MKQQALTLGLAFGLLGLLWMVLRTPTLLPLAHEIPAAAVAAPLASQRQVTATPAIELEALVDTVEGCPNQSNNITVTAGSTVYYCYSVLNTGGVTLTEHSLDDDQFGEIIPTFSFTLGPNQRYAVTDAISRVIDAPFTNTAVWTAQDGEGIFDPVTSEATTVVTVDEPIDETPSPSLAITLTVGLNEATCADDRNIQVPTGSTVYYCLTLQNTGGVTLTSHNFSAATPLINENLPNWIVPPRTTHVITYRTLEQLQLRPFFQQPGVAQTLNTTLTLRSTAENGETVTAASNAVVRVGRASISIRKTVSTSPTQCAENVTTIPVAPDQPVYYCLKISNTGEITLTHHQFSEEGSENVKGEFNYTLGPGQSMPDLTNGAIGAIPGLVPIQTPSLGPVTLAVTTVKTLRYTATNDENFRATITATTTINVSQAPLVAVLRALNSVIQQCPEPFLQTYNIGNRIWYCLTIKNNTGVQLTYHRLQMWISPPFRQGDRYAYTATAAFTQTLDPNATMVITNAFFTRTLTPPLAPIFGPYTVTAPLTNTNKLTGTILVSSSVGVSGSRLQSYSSIGVFVNPIPPTATSTWTPTPGPTNTPTPTPTNTPFGGPPTPTLSPTPTAVSISALPQPTPTPNVFVSSNVNTPPPQFQSPLGQPTPTPTTFFSELATPTFTPDPVLLSATQTAEGALTATAQATLFTATPTATATPLPTNTATPTPTATSTATPTATQRAIEQPTATGTPDTTTLFAQIVDASFAAAGWIWFITGSLIFFVTAGVVAGLSFRRQERQRYRLSPSSNAPPNIQPTAPTPPLRPERPAADEDEDWPTSLP